MRYWIFQLAQKDKDSLGTVRCFPGLEAVVQEGQIWLRLPQLEQGIPLDIQRLPIEQTFVLDPSNLLFPKGKQTPIAKIGKLDWVPLIDFIPVSLPVSSIPGYAKESYLPQLIRSQEEQTLSGLRTSWASFYTYAIHAPQARLEVLSFAASDNGEVLLLGHPLPPIPGNAYWQQHDLLIPAGYHFDLPWIAPLLNKSLNRAGMHFILFDQKGQWSKVPKKAVLQVSRAAVRTTQKMSYEQPN